MTGEVNKQGKFNNTKQALKAAIQVAIPEGEVSGDWRETIGDMVRNLPFINVRIAPERIEDQVYDRNIGGGIEGSTADYFFTLHIFHSNCNESGYDKSKYAQDVATRIEDYLTQEPSPVGFDIDSITTRESEPVGGAHRISRVIIEGQLHILRID